MQSDARVRKYADFLAAAQVKFESSAFFSSGPAGVAACPRYSEDGLNLVRRTSQFSHKYIQNCWRILSRIFRDDIIPHPDFVDTVEENFIWK